jgi:hypothetical protein
VRLAWSIALELAPGQVDEAHAAALLGYAEAGARHDPARGPLLTFAYPRMRGRALDLRRSEARLWRLRQVPADLIAQPQSSTGISARVDLRRAVQAVQPQLSSAEAIVLQHVYANQGTLRSAAVQHHRSEDQLQRAHDKLLHRLRKQLALQPNSQQPRIQRPTKSGALPAN